MPPERFYEGDLSVHYDAAWGLCRYLLREVGEASPERKAFRELIARLREGKPDDEAMRATLLKLDQGALEAGWRVWAMAPRKAKGR